MKKNAEAKAIELAQYSKGDDELALQKHRWVSVRRKNKPELRKDTRCYTFSLPQGKLSLSLGTCQHIQLRFHSEDRMVARPYTPTRPVVESEEDEVFQLVVKTYFPNDDQPGGVMSNSHDCIPLNEEIEVRGPTDEIEYRGND